MAEARWRTRSSALLYPVVAVATVATVVASQALVSGAFSLTQQAAQYSHPEMARRST
jgi:K+ transporter